MESICVITVLMNRKYMKTVKLMDGGLRGQMYIGRDHQLHVPIVTKSLNPNMEIPTMKGVNHDESL